MLVVLRSCFHFLKIQLVFFSLPYQFYWDIINRQHCRSLKWTTRISTFPSSVMWAPHFLPQNHEHRAWKFPQSFAKLKMRVNVPSFYVDWLPHMPLGTPLTVTEKRDRQGHHRYWGPFLEAGRRNSFLCGLMVRAKPQYSPPSSLDTTLPTIQPQFPTGEPKEQGAPSWTRCSLQKRAELPISLHTSHCLWICHRLWRQRDVWGWARYLISHWLIFHL